MPDIDPSGRANALPRLVPERLREAREARGLTGEQLAEQIGVTRQAIAQYKSGQRVPLPEIFSKIIDNAPTAYVLPFAKAAKDRSYDRAILAKSKAHGSHRTFAYSASPRMGTGYC